MNNLVVEFVQELSLDGGKIIEVLKRKGIVPLKGLANQGLME